MRRFLDVEQSNRYETHLAGLKKRSKSAALNFFYQKLAILMEQIGD